MEIAIIALSLRCIDTDSNGILFPAGTWSSSVAVAGVSHRAMSPCWPSACLPAAQLPG
jgi:hypothetical protein